MSEDEVQPAPIPDLEDKGAKQVTLIWRCYWTFPLL